MGEMETGENPMKNPAQAHLVQIQVLPSTYGPVIYAIDANGNLWKSSDICGERTWILVDNPPFTL